MNDPLITPIAYTLITFFFLWAIYEEYNKHDIPFRDCNPNIKDSPWKCIQNLEKCIYFDRKTIKWRRVMVATVLIVFTIFCMVHGRFPDTREFLLYFFIIFAVFYATWQHYSRTTSVTASTYAKSNLDIVTQYLDDRDAVPMNW